MPKQGRVLIIAGSDPGGGAGIQADIKTVTCLGGYASAVITALTAQNTQGVFGIHDVPADFVRQQITLVLDDIGADAIKTGMLHTAEIIEVVAETLKNTPPLRHPPSSPRQRGDNGLGIPLILDPVMFAKGGAALLETSALAALKEKLLPLAEIVTPNIPEAEYLADMKIHSVDDMKKAAQKILKSGCKAVLLKGGHMDGDILTDILADKNGMEVFSDPRINTKHTHGTGCTLASAIATGLAQGLSLKESVTRARAFVRTAMENAPGLGKGHGPLKHNFSVKI